MRPDINEIIRYIARREGVSAQEVINEMQQTIDEEYHSPDPTVQAYWKTMPFAGKPTPQELILYLAEREGGIRAK